MWEANKPRISLNVDFAAYFQKSISLQIIVELIIDYDNHNELKYLESNANFHIESTESDLALFQRYLIDF